MTASTELVTDLENFLFDFLFKPQKKGHNPERKGLELVQDHEHRIVQESLDRQDTRKWLSANNFSPEDIKKHLDEMKRNLAQIRTPSRNDWECFFHIPPSIYHIHMHCALKGEQFRRYSSCQPDVYSMPSQRVKQMFSAKPQGATCKKADLFIREDGVVCTKNGPNPPLRKPN
jgi:hypothetical protein